MADIDFGQLSEALNDKMDRDAHNVQSPSAVVIEKQDPTSANNYTWYRKYSDGWVEQGCLSVYPGTSWTLPIAMANDKYTLVASYVDSASVNSPQWQYMGIQQYSTYITPKANGLSQRIYICGMSAN